MPAMYAVLDMGSNSFHLVIAEKIDGKMRFAYAGSDKVQLAEDLARSGRISRDARQRALAALEKYRNELSRHPVEYLCVVGTNTLREAKNAPSFIEEANALGFPVNVISGLQEAFYIYQGVQSGLPASDQVRLVFDIGGGSTEFALGRDSQPTVMDSLTIGCVTARLSSADDDVISHKSLARMRRSIHEKLDRHLNPDFYELDWTETYASSGTAKMLRAVLKENNLTDGTITLAALQELENIAVDLGSVSALHKLAGLKVSRRGVFASGLAIMQGILDHLGIDHVEYSDFALREGVLLGLVKQGAAFPLYTLHAGNVSGVQRDFFGSLHD